MSRDFKLNLENELSETSEYNTDMVEYTTEISTTQKLVNEAKNQQNEDKDHKSQEEGDQENQTDRDQINQHEEDQDSKKQEPEYDEGARQEGHSKDQNEDTKEQTEDIQSQGDQAGVNMYDESTSGEKSDVNSYAVDEYDYSESDGLSSSKEETEEVSYDNHYITNKKSRSKRLLKALQGLYRNPKTRKGRIPWSDFYFGSSNNNNRSLRGN